jgi:hypothetical protein
MQNNLFALVSVALVSVALVSVFTNQHQQRTKKYTSYAK